MRELMVVMIDLSASSDAYTNLLDATMGIRGIPVVDGIERQGTFPDVYVKDGVEYVTCSDEVSMSDKVKFEAFLLKLRGNEDDNSEMDDKFFMLFESIPDGIDLEVSKKTFYDKYGYVYKGKREKSNPETKGSLNYDFDDRNGPL
jgi:hypothetical protein